MGRKDSKKRKDRRRGAGPQVKLDLLINDHSDISINDRVNVLINDPLGISINDGLNDLINSPLDAPMWLDKQGVHAIIPGEKPDAATLERMTLDYQNRIRQSPMFDEMVNVYGLARAEELLKECRAEVR